ncbi:PAS domain S-box-containing protein/diguanylate cyclase (GGDEF)-like protein [Blastococcus colisei]|uniref:PAS domain S-box-containing protein/diguanylate cyclase (GGDEF)-like protein n=1 Tax=Blastococcus colisei TaxID=1564162 RepID=A0A543PJ66_9ACTN|nr:sensor domain-containing diguanylate cyclase [Blastococcus colisei]TQN44115.1 PAS domain S-box-containing protein/diguanylate cyclase (GGDEF)-like protein [Blastococcus colisei]
MDPLADLLRALTGGLFVALAATSLVLWGRRRDAPAKWAAVSFALLAGVTTVGMVIPDTGGEAVEWTRKLYVAVLICFPYCLHRFAAAFAGVSRRVEMPAAAATVLLVAATLTLAPLPEAGDAAPAWSPWYIGAVLLLWTALSLLVALRLWLAGRGQASVVRLRMRLLACASIGLSFAILTAGTTRDVSSQWPGLLVQSLAAAATVLFWAGLMPPRFLLASWRHRDEADLNQAVQSLVSATRREDIAEALLPHLVRVVGGRGAALLDEEQGVLAAHGDLPGAEQSPRASGLDAAEGAASPHRIDFGLRAGRLSLWVSPYTPFFGQEELHRVEALASLLDLALERIWLAEAEREAQQALNWERDFSARLVQSTSDCILAFDQHFRYTLWNPAMEKLTGVPASEVLGQVAFQRFPSIVESGDDRFFRDALDGQHVSTPERYFDVPETGVQGWFTTAYSPIRDDSGGVVGGLSVFRDVTPAKEAERLRREALHDPLTGLANRTLFFERLEHALTRLERHPGPVAVMYLDVDRFKQINDRFGHGAGDQVLCALGARLTDALRPEDTVARFGGDEIAILCEHVVDAAHATAIAERIIDAFRTPLALPSLELTVTVSVGIALAEHPGADPDRLIAHADAAMYRAKANGRGRAELHDAISLFA